MIRSLAHQEEPGRDPVVDLLEDLDDRLDALDGTKVRDVDDELGARITAAKTLAEPIIREALVVVTIEKVRNHAHLGVHG